jgi:leader peptidase (prepilin peptidase)/N-methyltransferase
VAVHRLPDRFVLAAAVGFLLLVAPAPVPGALVRATLGAAVCAFGLGVLALLPSGPGLGDVKLCLAIGAATAWVGWATMLFGLILASVSLLLVAAAMFVLRGTSLSASYPFGPALFVGAFVAAVVLPG